MSEIILLQAPSDFEKRPLTPPLGIAYLIAVLRDAGFSAKAYDLSACGKGLREYITEVITAEKPKIIGVSTATENFNNTIRILRIIRASHPNIVTLLGGIHPTFTVEECLEYDEVDIVVRGEGEKTIVELANYFLEGQGSLPDIQGIGFKKNQHVILTPERDVIHNLNEIPFPARGDFDLSRYQVPFSIVSTRGCPGRCVFCVSRVINKGRYRERSIENIMAELKTLPFDENNRFLAFQDSTLTSNRRRLLELCCRLKDSLPGVSWWCESRVDTLDEEMLQAMKESGCAGIEFGVEAGSQEVLNLIRKNITLEQVRNTVQMTSKAGIKPICTIMLGHHCDTKKTLRESIDLAISLKKDYGSDVFFNVVTPYPGTPFLMQKDEYGIEILAKTYDDFSPNNPIFNTKNLNANEIREAYINAMIELSQV